jgi:hypothetical protein
MQWPTLAALLGSTQTRENLDVPHWGSYNPCEGRVLEWRLRMYGMYHHPAWTHSPIPLLYNKELEGFTLTLEDGIR